MIPRPSRESGFVLVTILVLVLVFTITAFYAAGSTRIDTQIVNTVRNERVAFYAAEAGVAEALLRLGVTSPAPVTVAGVGTFNPSFQGIFAPDAGQPNWCAQIVFDGSGTYPSKSGTTVTTPSIQPSTSRIGYSTGSLGDATNLTLRWARPTPLDQGCTGTPAGAIRKINGQNVLQIVSTGRAGTARRTVILDTFVGGNVSTVVLRSDVCPGVRTQGSGAVAFPGSVVVNSSCSTAIGAGGSSSVSAAGSISVVGSGYSGNISPQPTTGVAPISDPLAALTPPSLVGRTVRSTSKKTYNSNTTIDPGVYIGGIEIKGGNVTMRSGVYIMRGGGFAVSSTGQVTMQAGTGAHGVLIYNTCATYPLCTSGSSYGAIDIKNNRPVNLTALAKESPEPDEWAGIVFWQERVSRKALAFDAGSSGDVNGLIYARDAALTMQGGSDLLHSQLLVGSIDLQGGPVIGSPTVWLDISGGAGGTVTAKAWRDF